MKDIIKNTSKSTYPLSKEEVEKLYNQDNLTLDEIAEISNTSRQRLARWMEFWCLERRSCIEGLRNKWKRIGKERGPNWRGGNWLNKKTGIHYTYAPENPRAGHNKCAPLHIVVAEERIGRILAKDEVVHHLDIDKSNNSSENLCVMSRSQHQALHVLLGRIGIKLISQGYISMVLDNIEDNNYLELVKKVYVEKLAEIPKEI